MSLYRAMGIRITILKELFCFLFPHFPFYSTLSIALASLIHHNDIDEFHLARFIRGNIADEKLVSICTFNTPPHTLGCS